MENLTSKIESTTDYEVLNFTENYIDIINKFGSDGDVIEISIIDKTDKEIINEIKKL